MPKYEVIVSNIGTVYGRASGEDVVLFCNNNIIHEYEGSISNSGEKI